MVPCTCKCKSDHLSYALTVLVSIYFVFYYSFTYFRVGHEVDAWVKRGFLSDKGTVTDTKPLFKIGQVVTVKLVR